MLLYGCLKHTHLALSHQLWGQLLSEMSPFIGEKKPKNSCRRQMKEWRKAEHPSGTSWMLQMCSKQAANQGILLVMLLDLIVSVSHCLEHCHTVEPVSGRLWNPWCSFGLISESQWFCHLLQFSLHILFMGLLTQLFDVSCPMLPKTALQNTTSFSFETRVWTSQPIMEAHSPGLHVYTTVLMFARGKGTGGKKASHKSKYLLLLLLLLTFYAGIVKWRLAPVCLFHLVWFSNLLEA